ncbi:MAG: hypothetical protein FJX57_21505, partial [Alphaproteobacteria bacterium]|nr:hypothetical protein [Alphaproteobacteria bacterium]
MIARRGMILALGATGIAPARAQAVPRRLGVLQVRRRAGAGERDVGILRDALAGLGWRDGRELVIEARFAEGDAARVPSLAAEVLAAKPDAVVAAPTATVATLRRLTASIPLILAGGGDPVGAGLAASLARPGGNVTGLSNLLEATVQKNLEILREIVPGRRRFAILITTNNVNHVRYIAEAEAAAAALGIVLTPTVIGDIAELDAAATTWSRAGCEALSVLPDGQLMASIHDVIAVATRAPAGDLSAARLCGGGRPGQLWGRHQALLAPRGMVCRPHLQGHQPGRAPDRAVDAVRDGRQPRHRARTRARSAALAAAACGRRDRMKRRDALSRLGGAAAMAPFMVEAQQRAMPVVGYVSNGTREAFAPYVAAFVDGLAQTGHVEGQNVAIEYRWVEGRVDRRPALIAELVGRPVNVLVVSGAGAGEARAATTTIPIVVTFAADPVKSGFVAGFNR